jgi:3-oxoacyl-[acyl-carrier protein] reductase
MQVEGKTALVTGGGTGVGRATALSLARLGCHVAVNYSRSGAEAEETAAAVQALGVRGIAVKADVAQDAACRRLVETTVKELGRLDVLVQSAGTTRFIPHGDLDEVGDDDWKRIFDVNVKGPFQCARAARKPMLDAGAGAIVNVSSIAGIGGVGSSIPYCASKASLNNLTPLPAPSRPRRVNAVAPGFITGRWLEGARATGVKKAMEARALRKVCEPEDSPPPSWASHGIRSRTGQILVVDGGLLIAG